MDSGGYEAKFLLGLVYTWPTKPRGRLRFLKTPLCAQSWKASSQTGDRFFSQLARHLATALACQYSFVTELRRNTQTLRTLAVWGRGEFLENFEIPLKGTPSQGVLGGQIAHYPEHIQQLFPDDIGIKKWSAKSYCRVPLLDSAGACVGHLAIFHDKPMYYGPLGVVIIRIFAASARRDRAPAR